MLLIMNTDEYEIKSIYKLHYMFPAGLSYDKWRKLIIEHYPVKGFESFLL